MERLLKQLALVVTMMTTSFKQENINGLTAELLNRIMYGIDLILYSSKNKYPYVEQKDHPMQFEFTLAGLQDLEKLIKELSSEYKFNITCVRVMLPADRIQIVANGKASFFNLISAGWKAYQLGNEIYIYIKIS